MTYQETLSFLYNSTPAFHKIGGKAYKPGLSNTLALDKYLKHPHTAFRTIHVGGTNGKGSVSHTLAAILQSSGYKTGLYTSPHLTDFRERIRVDGRKIPSERVVQFVADNLPIIETVEPSFFEITMMMAFDYFRTENVDFAIVEVGLGGRLDSTNIISPILSVITNISFDHTAFLGNTLSDIAFEKAGIIKDCTPVVIGETYSNKEIKAQFLKKAQEVNAPIVFADEMHEIFEIEDFSDGIVYQLKDGTILKGELKGVAQKKNTATILAALDFLQKKFEIPTTAIKNGFRNVMELTGLQGRWQIIKAENPKIICDTAHNTAGIKYVVQQLKEESYSNLHIVLGMVADKDIDTVLSIVPQDAIYYFTQPNCPRAFDEKKLFELALLKGKKGRHFASVSEALEAVLKNSELSDMVYIGGSNFVVAEALLFFKL